MNTTGKIRRIERTTTFDGSHSLVWVFLEDNNRYDTFAYYFPKDIKEGDTVEIEYADFGSYRRIRSIKLI